MEGLYFRKAGAYLERVTQESGTLSLLAKAGDFEVMEQVVKAGREFCVFPGNNEDLIEFFFIMSGKILCDIDNTQLKSGDIFYVNKLNQPVYFTVLEEVRLLYIINDSLFIMLSDSIKKLTAKLSIIEKKDVFTEKHSERVMQLTIDLARKLNLDGINMMELTYASLFHDLGKIDVPDEILLKPARLTSEEFEYIKKHPGIGKSFADEISYMAIGEIIEQHHERMDGTGYPNGLKGNEIRVESRIIAVVDSYDAMTSDRSYRKAMTKDQAVEELIKYRGSHYDPTILDAFIELLNEDRRAND